VEVFLNLWFYLTPILYSLERVPDKVEPVMLINPMTSLIEAWRDLFLDNKLPAADIWPALVFTAVTLVAGIIIFRTLEERFEDAL
jgi:lipopolysaccharide transport system permease protein